MGNCASGDGDKAKQRPNEDPELMGKFKFLSCPSLSEVSDPSQNKWLILVFAPLTHHGLIFAARSAKDGTLLVKDIVDKQVAKEKEEQKVQLSYNLFFKAISTEVAKAGRSGAKLEWMADGSVSIECKIAISGSASSNKKPDTYTAVLKRVESSEANMFKYIVEPLATHYCKKRTDGWNLDRPDPHKEKVYGEQEANAIMRSASMRVSQAVLDKELPAILPLRHEHTTSRADRDKALAKVNLMKQMLLARSTAPPLLRLPPEDAFATVEPTDCGLNLMSAALEPHIAFPRAKDITAFTSRPAEAPSTSYATKFESLSEPLPSANPLLSVGVALFETFDLAETVKPAALRSFLYRIEGMHRPTNRFHTAARAAERLHAFGVLVRLAFASGFSADKSLLSTAFLAAAMHDVDHCGLHNRQGAESSGGGFIPCLYNFESFVERHSLAVGLCEARYADIKIDVDAAAAIVIATDLAKHGDFVMRFSRRTRETADFSRRYDDQVMAFAALLKCADLSHLAKDKEHLDSSMKDLASEHADGDSRLSLTSTDNASLSVFVQHVAGPLFQCVSTAFSRLSVLADGCTKALGVM